MMPWSLVACLVSPSMDKCRGQSLFMPAAYWGVSESIPSNTAINGDNWQKSLFCFSSNPSSTQYSFRLVCRHLFAQ